MKTLISKVAGLLFIGVVCSQTFAADLSKSTNIRADLAKNCSESFTKNNVLSASEASKFCKCTIDSQAKITNAEEWEIQSAINAKKDPRSLASVKRTETEVQNCAGTSILQKIQAAAAKAQQAAATQQKK